MRLIQSTLRLVAIFVEEPPARLTIRLADLVVTDWVPQLRLPVTHSGSRTYYSLRSLALALSHARLPALGPTSLPSAVSFLQPSSVAPPWLSVYQYVLPVLPPARTPPSLRDLRVGRHNRALRWTPRGSRRFYCTYKMSLNVLVVLRAQMIAHTMGVARCD